MESLWVTALLFLIPISGMTVFLNVLWRRMETEGVSE